MNPFSSGTRLRDMIRAIRACKTAAEERAVIRKECASIRASISENDQDYMHRNLAKLMFIHMLGYPTHFGQMECLKLIASPGFPEKRIGYLGLMLLLDERQEVLMLVTNSIKQDLNHTNQYIVGLALCALGNICSAEMARDLAPEVERLLQFRDPNIRKKAALCTIRIIKKVPDLAENFINAAAALLKEKHHGVLITGAQLCTDMCKVSTEAHEHFRKKCLDGVVKLLRDLANSPYAPEYDISGITDPLLHIRLLKLLHVLGQGDVDASDTMNDVLAQVATKTESNKNAGNAILYECVATIMSIEDNGGLRVLAVNILGRFLSSRDNNIRYVALNMLMKAISLDSQAVQRHRATIVECVKDPDASIRKRALELVYLLVNESNAKSLTKELVDYLEVSDLEFKEDLTAKICSIVEKFSPEKLWYIDQMVKVLSEAGNYVKDEVWHALIVVITNAPNLHGYTVRALYKAVQKTSEQETLVRVAVWCIGEYGEMLVSNAGMLDVEDPITVTEADAVDLVETAIKRHSSDLTTQAMCLVALLKLSSRYPSCAKRINDTVLHQKGSLVLELQQRAIEFNSIIEKHEKIRAALVERMPVLDEATYSGRRAGSVPAAASTSLGALPKMSNGVAKPISAPLVDLLDLSSDDVQAPSSSGGDFLHDLLGVDLSPASPVSGTNNQAPKNGTDALLDLLSVGAPTAQSNSSMLDMLSSEQDNKRSEGLLDNFASLSTSSARSSSAVASSSMMDLLDGFGPSSSVPVAETDGPSYPSVVAFESSSLRITFNFSKEPGNPQTTVIEAQFVNKSSDVYSNFVFQAAVPKFLQLHLEPASGNTLPASGNGSITQKLEVSNSQHGNKSLVMRVRINYKVNGKDVLEDGQISNFPRGL
ncbi:AP-1 complex subunit gamma-2-like isoform X1 [Salvia miltiorrhiza]|uniref:AP-1 complex subunit gamma-2-like isoform X1 n=1 Tax=Salvia miltiorrhiza TaxID=226208 RepID=UPI0025AC36EA|nr:AP-1 complex subunit gamma-2-like isoform X1 [Salvia miltiorrhiza]